MTTLKEENKRLEAWIDDLQSGMYINCVYCGHRYGPNSGPDTKDFNLTMRKALEQHIAECPKHPLSSAKAEIAKKDEDDKQVRLFLLFNHGHSAPYIDDGEMQCGECMPIWDYKRLPLKTLISQFMGLQAEQIAALQARIRELEESRDEWKRQWRLMEAGNKMAEGKVTELEGALEKIKHDADNRVRRRGQNINDIGDIAKQALKVKS